MTCQHWGSLRRVRRAVGGGGRGERGDARRAEGAGLTCDDDGAGGRVDGRQPHHVLPHLLEVLEGALLPLHYGTHPAERGALERLTPVE
eukprot:scaffold155360_cov25-Tisochrysis_lutea.AAC.5